MMSLKPSSQSTEPRDIDPHLRQFLLRNGLARLDSEIRVTTLPGGVSCDVWRVEAAGRTFCVKRALPRLRVAKLWEAPIARSEHEWNWLNFAGTIVPDAVPRPLAHDAELGMIAIAYLDPQRFPVWKQLLLDGTVQIDAAAAAARILARIHAASAGNPEMAQFRTREAFYALRIEPYLLESARQNPAVSDSLNHLAECTLATEIALVHGDFSPKNILIGPESPVILDAETAWYGDPAFDVAFCLNHLLLKYIARRQFATAYLACFDSFRAAYLASVTWEAPAELESRATRLLPALLLARVDGKSPVEYLAEAQQSFVRRRAIALIHKSHSRLDEIAEIWKSEIDALNSRAEHPEAG
jgi:aminoglycoside phosphotransferase (APT) family kinase protein